MMANEQATNPYAGMPQAAHLWPDGTYRTTPPPYPAPPPVDMVALRKWAFEQSSKIALEAPLLNAFQLADRIVQYALTGKPSTD